MGSLNSKQLEIARCLCLGRDGPICKLCQKPFADSKTIADVDHIDGNKHNNPKDGSNWQLAHHPCNVAKWWFQKQLAIINDGEKYPKAYTISTKFELTWIRWMIDDLEKNHKMTWDNAKFTGALEANCNPVTTERYLKKHVTNSGHPKALFKAEQDPNDYGWYVVFNDKVKEYIDDLKSRT